MAGCENVAVRPIALAASRAPAPLALMALIFWLSAQPDLDTGLGVWDLILRKLGHALVFGALAALWWWALHPLARRPIPIAAAIALLYAVLDEYHQSFVEGRSGTVSDVAFDLAGIVVASLLLRRYSLGRRLAVSRRGRARNVQMSPERTRSANPDAS